MCWNSPWLTRAYEEDEIDFKRTKQTYHIERFPCELGFCSSTHQNWKTAGIVDYCKEGINQITVCICDQEDITYLDERQFVQNTSDGVLRVFNSYACLYCKRIMNEPNLIRYSKPML